MLGYVPINEFVKEQAENWTSEQVLFILFVGWFAYAAISKKF